MAKDLEEKILLFQNEINKLIPQLDLEPNKYGSGSSENPTWHHAHFSIPPENGRLAGSQYFFTGKELVHFTSIQAAESIIKSGVLRLYNLNHLEDPREFHFAGDLFNLTQPEMNDARKNIYVSSCCEKSILIQREIYEQFNQWRLYGDNGNGVAIMFEILNNPLDWNNFHLSKVIYGSRQRNQFNSLVKLTKQLEEQEVTFDFSKLCVLHKSRMYHLEKEVRLFHDRRQKRAGMHGISVFDYDSRLIFPEIKKCDSNKCNKQDCYFVELPIFPQAKEFIEFEGIPIIGIKKIILGFKWKTDYEPKRKLMDLFKSNLGYSPEIEFSNLVKPFWGKQRLSPIKNHIS